MSIEYEIRDTPEGSYTLVKTKGMSKKTIRSITLFDANEVRSVDDLKGAKGIVLEFEQPTSIVRCETKAVVGRHCPGDAKFRGEFDANLCDKCYLREKAKMHNKFIRESKRSI